MPGYQEFPEADVAGSIATRFARQVEASPDRLAVRHLDHQLTYQDLDRAANRIAQALLAALGDREEPILVLVEPGAGAIVLLLGVLKAGKYYVPLDPGHPRSRLTRIVTDVDADVLLTTSDHHALAMEIATDRTRIVDADRIDARDDATPDVQIAGSRLGFMFYTSGSTGRPKGVMQTQRNILHHIRTYSNALRITADDRVTMLHSHAFSASRLDIFSALLNGATLFPLSVTETGLAGLVKWFGDERITVSHWVPTLFRYFVRTLNDDDRYPFLRVIVLGSEPVVPGDVALYKRKHFGDDCILINRFGATETGNISWAFLDKHSEFSTDVVSVGFPAPGAEVLVLDEDGKPAQSGQVGQIAVRSAYLSPGYWKNPELTREVFLPDPQGGERRIYLSGDLGRIRPDGALEHLGRQDSQVKVRGFRVELQEIEALLSTHPDVQESAVGAFARDDGETQLVAFAVSMTGRVVRSNDIRAWLEDALPFYMVPSTVAIVEALPRTATGKVDRLALAALHRSVSSTFDGSQPPSDPTERTLVGMWAEILGLIAVAATDNFFALGGNSLLAAQLMMRIDRTFGRQLPPAVVFRAPTVKQLAELLRGERVEPLPSGSLVPIQPHGSRSPFFWIHGDWSNAFLAEFLGPDQPLYGVMHQSLDGRAAAYTRVETLAEHYLRQIRSVQANGPYLLGGYSFGGTVAFEVARRLAQEGEKVSLLAMLDSLFPGGQIAGDALEHSRTTSGAISQPEHRLSHFEKLATLSLRDRVTYIRIRVANRLDAFIGSRLSRSIKNIVCGVCLRMSWRLPVFVRSHYILSIYHEAIRSYTPAAYSGHAVYFKSIGRSSVHQQRWAEVVAGGFDVREVPGDHEDVIKRERAAAWAGQLRRLIAEAQPPLERWSWTGSRSSV
ncbi:MAG TPA: amino acid adenylation domain-containing protein [Vicinamibacterales bacterium]|nr:amino acid adenylation domain-containing protein [Vicinamibacterales bacterium]